LKYSRYGLKRRQRSRLSKVRVSKALIVWSLAVVVIAAAAVAAVNGLSRRAVRRAEHGTFSVRVTNSLSTLAGQAILSISSRNRRIVYPYSVVPGGVTSAAELREVATHDRIVANHYQGFDYRRARITHVNHPQLVYLSYRRGNRVYWTRKRISLHKGETLLTDGRITARTRCGNQVSVLPQANTAPAEPTEAELDRPDLVASGVELIPPVSLGSSVLQLDPSIPIGPEGGGVGGPGVYVPLPIGGPVAGGTGGCQVKAATTSNSNCQPPPPPPPPTVPEPGTIVLLGSGAAALYARWRMKRL
jgi:PEP-CTERM motif